MEGKEMSPFDKNSIKQSFSVLYVEDEEAIREIMVEILELFVDDIYIAKNGSEGLEVYKKQRPDLIITDIQMPVMTGIDMMKEIRKLDEEIPIVVTSAFNDNTFLLNSIALNVDHYLIKPVVVDQLESKLNKVKKQIMQKRELDAYQLYLEDRVQQEIALREAKEALLFSQNKDAELGQMVSVIAHQWKQPLHYLHLLIEDLGYEYEEGLSDDFIKNFISKGIDRVNFLSDTMDNFLHFYKSDHDIKSFSVSEVIKEISFFLSSLFDALGIDIELQILKDFSLKGSKNEFQQVILNLLNNAKEAYEGQKKRDAKIVVTVDAQNDASKVVICDNASGIDEAIFEKIFEMEYTTKKSGNGIGLYLVKKIVKERFHGEISVSNIEGGACFTLTFD